MEDGHYPLNEVRIDLNNRLKYRDVWPERSIFCLCPILLHLLLPDETFVTG